MFLIDTSSYKTELWLAELDLSLLSGVGEGGGRLNLSLLPPLNTI